MSAESRVETILLMLEQLKQEGATDRLKFENQLFALRAEIEQIAQSEAEREALLSQYAEAYEKLTAPANRIGLYLQPLADSRHLIAQGEGELVALADPKVNPDDLTTGTRVLLNEAYAIVGTLPPHEGGAQFRVIEVVDERRLRIAVDAQGSATRLVWRGPTLSEVVAGDEVRVEPSGRVAVETIPSQETQDYFVEEVPPVEWSDVGGQQEAIRLIRETIEHPLLYPEIYARFGKKPIKGVLLFGPPGCGKTLIGKAIAHNLAKEYSARVGHEVKDYFMHISGPKILNMWLGESERMVREIFATARKKAKEGKLVVIFIDEAESLLRTRSSGRQLNISNTIVPQFCAELDGMVSLENVVIVLTSNRPDFIDPAILRPERIDRKVKIARPDRESSESILAIHLAGDTPLDPELLTEWRGEAECARKALIEGTVAHLWRENKETEFLQLTERSSGQRTLYWLDMVSGALLKSVVDRAKEAAIRRAISEPTVPHGISMADMREALVAEFRENEIFPRSDATGDWLKLIDIEPEQIVSVRPLAGQKVRASKSDII
ncbi:MAG: AAA family ATPase [Chthonomonas sp.]|nr:AAA family ATPase [Chthonomonas sp.]